MTTAVALLARGLGIGSMLACTAAIALLPGGATQVQAAGTTYYVSVTGDDNNPGTETQPFRTVQRAADMVNPGDTVIVEDGTYTGTGAGTACASSTSRPVVCLTRGGTSTAWVTFRARNLFGAKIDGQFNTSTHGFRFLSNANYIRVEGFEVFGMGSTTNGVSGFLIYSGGRDVVIAHNDIHDIGRLCTDHIYGMSGIFIQNARVTVEGNRIHNIGRFAPGEQGCSPATTNYQNHDHGIYVNGKNDGSAAGANNIQISNNRFWAIQRGWPIQVYPDPVASLSVLHNTFALGNPYRNGHIILAASTSNSRIVNNVFDQPTTAAINFNAGTHTNLAVGNNLSSQALATATPSGVTWADNFEYMDPQLGPDYQVQSGSPAIDLGQDLPEVVVDIDGTARPQGAASDIGADESGGGEPQQTVATPTITPGGGSFSSSVSVSLATSTAGATVRYTTNGTTPTSSSPAYSSPFTVSSSLTVRAKAFASGMLDSAEAQAAFSIQSDTTAPSVVFTSPTNGATVSGSRATMSATASDDVGVTSVRFMVDGGTIATDTSAPYSASWRPRRYAKGSHTLRAIATDAAGNSTTASIIVTVN